MRWLADAHLRYGPSRLRSRAAALGNGLRLYAALLLFGALCLVGSAAMMALGWFMPRRRRQRFVRAGISACFRFYLAGAERSGLMRLELDELDALRDQAAMIIAPNHPSSIDAALVLSRLPDLCCVMKAQILDNPLFGSGARMAAYVSNDPPRRMLRAATDNLRAGQHLLLFPEGTRTLQSPLDPLQRTVGLIAKMAGAPVQTVHVETSTAFLCKGWPLLRIPLLPMVYRMRLGRRFEAPSDVDGFTAELEHYFRSELAGARLPDLPVRAHSR